ncbi:MAG: glycoside hydrolase family 31 protein [Sphaerochaetaceae bacterium]
MSANNYQIDGNIVTFKSVRISVITDRLIRFEYSKDKKFIDDKSMMAVNRDYKKVDFTVEEKDGYLNLYTDELIVECDGYKFSETGLFVALKKPILEYGHKWFYGEDVVTFGGTARTLDDVDGECELEPGLFSQSGYSVIDDSKTMLLTDDGFVKPRTGGNEDLYFFGYGRDFKAGLKDFYELSGKTPLIPRYALGNWWSRYYKYTQESYLALMNEFTDHDVPLSVSVIDMDWHYVDLPKKFGSGWTGYSWNKDFFPDPKGFLAELKRRGLKVTVNEHPADGIKSFEVNYEKMAESMGIDPKTEQTVLFDASSRQYLDALQENILGPLEEDGIDFWWIDWQQGSFSKIEGLDPLLVLNITRFNANKRGNNRPLIFSRYAGPGSHRYPIGFSGDTHITWDSLKFQPKFTSTASNIGFGWWSHDIGGHMLGIKDNDLEIRWYQLGVFSPINRLHCSNSLFTSKEPWRYEKNTSRIMCEYLRIRHQLIPYLYTMAYRAFKEDTPLVLPMYHVNPDEAEAYKVETEYYFGDNMIVSPIVTPQIDKLLMGKAKVYLPEGKYYDFFSSRRYEGGRTTFMYRSLEELPILIKMGDIIPLTDEKIADINPKNLTFKVYMGSNGTFDLYEDDNMSSNYERGINATTLVENNFDKKYFRINKVQGDRSLVPEKRNYTVVFVGIAECDLSVKVDECDAKFESSYDDKKKELCMTVKGVSTASDVEVYFDESLSLIQRDKKTDLFDLLDKYEISIELKDSLFGAFNENSIIKTVSTLASLEIDKDIFDSINEIILCD